MLVRRLEQKITGDCGPLIEKLGSLGIEDNQRERVRVVLERALAVRSATLVEAAVKTAMQFNLLIELRAEIRESYEYWLRNGPLGPKGGGVVPPNAALALLTVLVDNQQLNYRRIARDTAAGQRTNAIRTTSDSNHGSYQIFEDDERLLRTLSEIADGTLPAEIVYELAKTYPQICREHFEDIVNLLETGQSSAKIACIRILGDGMFDVARVRPVLIHLLQFDDPTIRNEAVASLRRLKP